VDPRVLPFAGPSASPSGNPRTSPNTAASVLPSKGPLSGVPSALRREQGELGELDSIHQQTSICCSRFWRSALSAQFDVSNFRLYRILRHILRAEKNIVPRNSTCEFTLSDSLAASLLLDVSDLRSHCRHT
jgi:hypothetical protein